MFEVIHFNLIFVFRMFLCIFFFFLLINVPKFFWIYIIVRFFFKCLCTIIKLLCLFVKFIIIIEFDFNFFFFWANQPNRTYWSKTGPDQTGLNWNSCPVSGSRKFWILVPDNTGSGPDQTGFGPVHSPNYHRQPSLEKS